jgi:hypothetical protein
VSIPCGPAEDSFDFDRESGGFGRESKATWKLSELKKTFSHWQVEMEKAGGWNSN